MASDSALSRPSSATIAKNAEILAVTSMWVVCSIGMMVFNKLAVTALPLGCTLVAIQMLCTVLAMTVFCWGSLHIGSLHDLLRWARVAPFFAGVLLTSMFALKNASMSLVIVFRGLAPLCGMMVERFFPTPLQVTWQVVVSILILLLGVGMYAKDLEHSSTNMTGIGWVLLNNFFVIGDRLMQRIMLAKDQSPVDISKSGCTLLNNLLAMIPIAVAAWCNGEISRLPVAMTELGTPDVAWIFASCAVGVGIAYVGIWAQSLISATSFLVLATSNKFGVILIEVLMMGSKSLSAWQLSGVVIVVASGILYGKAREAIEKHEQEAKAEAGDTSETQSLLGKKV